MKLNTFKNSKSKCQVKGKGITTVNSDTEILRRLLLVSRNNSVDVKDIVQKYELTSIPLSYATPQGQLYHSAKSVLLKEFEKYAASLDNLPSVDDGALLIDAMALIRSLSNEGVHQTVRDLCEATFHRLQRESITYKEVHLVFDRYDNDLSIKNQEREDRGKDGGIEVHITSMDTPLPKQMSKFWAVSRNKANLVEKICGYIQDEASSLLDGRTIVLAGGLADGETCLKITNCGVESLPKLSCSQEEADTRLMLHAKDAAERFPEKVVIWSQDTDVVVLSAYYFNRIAAKHLWIKCGTAKQRKYIPIHTLCTNLGTQVCQMLLVLHAAFGCDYTSSVRGIGKGRPLAVVMENVKEYIKLKEVGKKCTLTKEAADAIEKIICRCHEKGSTGDISKLRFKYFLLGKDHLPGTKDSTYLHSQRVNYTVAVWKSALTAKPKLESPIGNGWELIEEALQPKLMDQPAAPPNVFGIVRCKCMKGRCLRNCSCNLKGLSCTEVCGCQNGDGCLNRNRIQSNDNQEDSDDE